MPEPVPGPCSDPTCALCGAVARTQPEDDDRSDLLAFGLGCAVGMTAFLVMLWFSFGWLQW